MQERQKKLDWIRKTLDPMPTNTELFCGQKTYAGEKAQPTDLFRWVGEGGSGEILTKSECEKIAAARHVFIKINRKRGPGRHVSDQDIKKQLTF